MPEPHDNREYERKTLLEYLVDLYNDVTVDPQRRVLKLCKEVVVGQKEPFDGAIENDHLYLLVGFEGRDNLIQLRDRLRAEDIQWWNIKRDAPVAWRASRETDLSGFAHVAHFLRS